LQPANPQEVASGLFIAEAAGGTLLILIGAKILLDHTLGG
jgi:hypothetical protein